MGRHDDHEYMNGYQHTQRAGRWVLVPAAASLTNAGFTAVAIQMRDGRQFALGADDPAGLISSLSVLSPTC